MYVRTVVGSGFFLCRDAPGRQCCECRKCQCLYQSHVLSVLYYYIIRCGLCVLPLCVFVRDTCSRIIPILVPSAPGGVFSGAKFIVLFFVPMSHMLHLCYIIRKLPHCLSSSLAFPYAWRAQPMPILHVFQSASQPLSFSHPNHLI